jgi:hypothetical protein
MASLAARSSRPISIAGTTTLRGKPLADVVLSFGVVAGSGALPRR